MATESLAYDLVIVGAGPAGLAAAIRFKQLCQQQNQHYTVAVFEKAAKVGAHTLSGAVLELRALNELLPDWQTLNPPAMTDVSKERFYYLTPRHALALPTPGVMKNTGNKIISLGQYCEWLAGIAESYGVDIFPGFAVDKVCIDKDRVIGIQTGDKGLDKSRQPGQRYEPGLTVLAKHTLLAEGCRGNCSEAVISHFHLRQNASPQTYGLGIKELWQVPEHQHQQGLVWHSVGWPLDKRTYGGAFIYHLAPQQVALGLVVGLDYRNPYTDPFQACQQLKTHPRIAAMLQGGQRIGFGARAINEGGWQSIPELAFPGGALIGCAAGFVNIAKIKGTHTATESGSLAANLAFDKINNDIKDTVTNDTSVIKQSWVGSELYRVRNLRPAFSRHLWLGLAYTAWDQFICRGRSPWTLRHHGDHQQLHEATRCTPPNYPMPDGQLVFDKLSSVFLTGVRYREDQPCHLLLKDETVPIRVNLQRYAAPEQYYCPANVYEITTHSGENVDKLQINATNCIQCKACDIKDPLQNIQWTPPEGGDGPMYSGL